MIVTRLHEAQQVWYRRFSVDPVDRVEGASRIAEAAAGVKAQDSLEDRP